jgi:hypothetical protein
MAFVFCFFVIFFQINTISSAEMMPRVSSLESLGAKQVSSYENTPYGSPVQKSPPYTPLHRNLFRHSPMMGI